MKSDTKQIMTSFQKIMNEEVEEMQRQNSAYSNIVYIIKTKNNRYIFKQYVSETIIDKNLEIHIQQQIGIPEILHYNKNFRIEVFLEHKSVCWENDFTQIAKELKKFHSLSIDCDFTHADMLNNILDRNKDIKNNKIISKACERVFEIIKACDQFCMCHNDLQVGNMLKIGDEIRFIDFEYTCRGNPFIDIANLFCETMCDYQNDCLLKAERGFSISTKIKFLQIYSGTENVDELLKKVSSAEIFCHLYWFLWGRNFHITKTGPSDDFNYCDYSNSRLYFLVQYNIITKDEYDELKLEKF